MTLRYCGIYHLRLCCLYPAAPLHILTTSERFDPPLMIETPLQDLANACHHSMSTRKDRFSMIMWSFLQKCERSPNIPRRKCLPGLITLQAWLRWPASDWRSRLVHALRCLHFSTTSRSFTCGSLNSSRSGSTSIPNSVIIIAGSSVCSCATWISRRPPGLCSQALPSVIHSLQGKWVSVLSGQSTFSFISKLKSDCNALFSAFDYSKKLKAENW